MGMRPSGLGLRLKSLQLQPVYIAGVGGKRCPFDLVAAFSGRSPFVNGAEAIGVWPFATGLAVGFVDVSLASFLVSIGLRLRVRALRRSGLSSSSRSSSTGFGVVNRLLAADLVVGPKYDSRAAASFSDGVGLGEITRGVAGTIG